MSALPAPQVWIELENCNQRPDGGCSTRPTLILRGEEPLPDEHITSIAGKVGSVPLSSATVPPVPSPFM